MATLAAKILELYDGKRSTREIAEAVYGRPPAPKDMAYVRVVARQRKGCGASEADLRYLSSGLGRETRRKRDIVLQPARTASIMARYRTGDKDAAKRAARRAYEVARSEGLAVKDAKSASFAAYSRAMFQTGDKAAGRAAYALARQNDDRTNARGSTPHA